MQQPGVTTALARIREIVPAEEWVVLDTETTGIDYRAEIVQIAIIDSSGHPLLDSFVKPVRAIPPDAVAIHGITNEMVAGAPPLPDLRDHILDALRGKSAIVYNAEYDMRLLSQSARARGMTVDWKSAPRRWLCAMLAYAEMRGVPGREYGQYKWHKLGDAARHEGIRVEGAHLALQDCLTTLALVRRMARTNDGASKDG